MDISNVHCKEANEKLSAFRQRAFLLLPYILLSFVGWALYFLAVWPNIDTYNPQRVVQIAFFFVCCLFFMLHAFSSSKKSGSGLLAVSRAGLWFGVLCVLAGVLGSLNYSGKPRWSLLDLEYCGMLLACICILKIALSRFDDELWRKLGALAMIMMALYALRVSIEVAIFFPLPDRWRATPGLTNIRLYSDMAVVFMPLSWLIMNRPSGLAMKVGLWSVNIFWAWVLVVTQARAGLLSLAVASVWVAFRFARDGRKAMYFFASCIFFAAIVSLLFPVMETSEWAGHITSSSGRWGLWSLAIKYSMEAFPFGIGGMMFAADGRAGVASPHNLIFTIIAEWGWLTALGLFVIAFSFWMAERKKSAECGAAKNMIVSSPVNVAVTMAAIGAFVNAMFAGAHIEPMGAMMMIMAWGGWLAIYVKRPESAFDVNSGRLRPKVWAGLLMCVCIHMSFLGWQLHQLSQLSIPVCANRNDGPLYPRFWIEGRLDCGLLEKSGNW